MKIRPYEDADRPQVTALWQECFDYPASHNNPESSIRRKTAVDDQLFFVAEEDGVPVGTVMAGWDGHRGWIYSLAVRPDRRNRKIGSTLVEYAVDALEALDCPKVNLQIVSGNESLIRFYEKLGFNVEPRVSMGRILY